MVSNLFKGLVASAALSISCSASAGLILALDNGNDTLVSIDTDTFAVTTIGSLGTDANFAGLAYDFNTDTLYMAGGRDNNSLYTVNQNTGAATLIGNHGIQDLFAIAFDTTNNVLYGTQFSRGQGFYTLNTSNGSATTINNQMLNGIGGLTYNHTLDELIGMNDGPGDIFSIDRANGAQTLIHDGGNVNDSGFTYDADNNFYWDIDYSGNLFSYDIDNGYARTTHLTGLGNFDGAVYLNSGNAQPPVGVPEPSTLAILSCGIIGLVLRKRKRAI